MNDVLDPFDGIKPRLLRRGQEALSIDSGPELCRMAPLRVNPEPFGCAQGLELVVRRAQAFRPGSRRVDFHLIKSRRRRKTISLHIREGEIVIRAPYHTSKREVEEFIKEREKWIIDKLKEEEERRKEFQKAFVPGEKFLYLGEWYPLEINESDHEELPLKLCFGNFVLSKDCLQEARNVFIEWYKKEAKEKIQGRVCYYSDKFQLFPKGARITGARSRWGSCSRDNRLCFSWRIIMAPLRIIDYILVHELVHIKEKNHSRKFWAALEEILPDYKTRRVWLNENGHKLWL